MAITVLPNLILKGALSAFHQRMSEIPEIWPKHAMQTTSTTATEKYTFPGFIPTPRVFTDSRSIQGFRDFKFDLENLEYELTILIKRKDFEDDQTGTIMSRFRELAEVFATYKDQVFADLLANAGSDNAPMDGTSFYNTARTIGDSGTIDNDDTSAAATGTIPTAVEFMDDLANAKAKMRRFNDDTGRRFNSAAMREMRIILPPEFERPASEALNAAFIPMVTADAATENVFFKGMAQFDVLDYLSGADTMYINLLGAERLPFLYQQRTPLEVIIDQNPTNVAKRNGVLVMCRERWVMTYGDPRRSLRHVYT